MKICFAKGISRGGRRIEKEGIIGKARGHFTVVRKFRDIIRTSRRLSPGSGSVWF